MIIVGIFFFWKCEKSYFVWSNRCGWSMNIGSLWSISVCWCWVSGDSWCWVSWISERSSWVSEWCSMSISVSPVSLVIPDTVPTTIIFSTISIIWVVSEWCSPWWWSYLCNRSWISSWSAGNKESENNCELFDLINKRKKKEEINLII